MKDVLRALAWSSLCVLSILAAACVEPARVVRSPDASAAALDDVASLGEDGPYGVRLVPRAVRVRVDERIDVDVFVPVEVDGSNARARPVAVFVHGGLVAPERYAWLAVHLASRGFVVLVPSHALDLAFFEQGNAIEALVALRRRAADPSDALFGTMDDRPAAILGHSLGGVVSASLWDERPDDFDELVLLASYPSGSTLRPRSQGRALSIVGSADARVSITQTREGVRALATSGRPAELVVIDGMNHMQVADDVSASESEAAGTPSIDEATARDRVAWMIDALLFPRTGGSFEPLDDDSRWPPGVGRGAP